MKHSCAGHSTTVFMGQASAESVEALGQPVQVYSRTAIGGERRTLKLSRNAGTLSKRAMTTCKVSNYERVLKLLKFMLITRALEFFLMQKGQFQAQVKHLSVLIPFFPSSWPLHTIQT